MTGWNVYEPMALKRAPLRTLGVLFREIRAVDNSIVLPRDVSATFCNENTHTCNVLYLDCDREAETFAFMAAQNPFLFVIFQSKVLLCPNA